MKNKLTVTVNNVEPKIHFNFSLLHLKQSVPLMLLQSGLTKKQVNCDIRISGQEFDQGIPEGTASLQNDWFHQITAYNAVYISKLFTVSEHIQYQNIYSIEFFLFLTMTIMRGSISYCCKV